MTSMRLTWVEAVVRRVRADEGPVLKTVRLAALADAPSAFGSSYAAEVDQPDDHWTSRAELGAAGERSVTFFAVVDGSVVGLVAAYRPDAAGPSVERRPSSPCRRTRARTSCECSERSTERLMKPAFEDGRAPTAIRR